MEEPTACDEPLILEMPAVLFGDFEELCAESYRFEPEPFVVCKSLLYEAYLSFSTEGLPRFDDTLDVVVCRVCVLDAPIA